MPRIRSIKPGFFKSEDVSVLPFRARLTWIGLWTHCDDAGRAKDNVRLIKGDVWPLDDVSLKDIEDDLVTLAEHGRIVRYEVDGQRYLEITNWSVHQRINRATESRLPAPPVNGHGDVSEPSLQEGKGKGREGEQREQAHGDLTEPSMRCPRHVRTRNPPACGECAEARKEHSRWLAHRTARLAGAPKCAKHPGQLASNCGGCRSEKLGSKR